MDRSSRVRVSGSLAVFAPAFREQLAALGYAPSSAAAHLLLMAQLSRWLEWAGLAPGMLTLQRLDEFRRSNRELGHRFPRSANGMVPLLSYLRGVGVVPPEPAAMRTSSEELLDRFRQYLTSERGLGAGTIVGYVYAAGLFLKAVGFANGRDLNQVTPADVREFLLAERDRRSVASTKSVVSGLRAWLRFLHVEGITAVPLSGGVPAVAGWSGTCLPRGIDAASVQALLNGCDRRTIKGRRDFAVLLLMSRLGLRVGEVAALTLADIDWRGGQILIRGKANRVDRLPLPVDVGQALADYLQRGRAGGEHREVFLRVVAPYRAMTATGLKVIVHAACARVGLPPLGAHRLRHTVASELLRHGAGLPEIGQVLRHHSIASTAIYAKVDAAALRQLARPWPGRSGMTDLQLAAEQYLATRRAVGFKLTHVEPLLFDFVRFARSRNATLVTCELALRWATQPEGATPAWWKSRLCVVRCFARYLSAIDPATEVPPTDLLPRLATGSNRAEPYLYSDAELTALLAAARSIRSALTAATCETIIGLLAVTGMRVGEALRLDRDDLDRGRGVLIVRDSKFTRSREVPLHESTLAALDRYGRLRDLHRPTPRSASLFISRTGGRLSYRTMNWHFDRVVRKAGLQPRSDRCRPRLHDLRHRFACLTLQEWYRDGVEVQPRLPLLSTYLGHVDPNSTYWYLSPQPDLLAAAAGRLESSLREPT